MKCPYNNFQECIVEQCPSCVYEVVKDTEIVGRKPHYMSTEEAIKQGCQWRETRTSYKFVSCRLIDNCVQPIPKNNTIINNKVENKSSVSIRKSIF